MLLLDAMDILDYKRNVYGLNFKLYNQVMVSELQQHILYQKNRVLSHY